MKKALYLKSVALRLPRKEGLGGNVLELTWNDGKISAIRAYRLRISCPCAFCKGKNLSFISQNVEVIEQSPVGNYALNFLFSDGHNSGIYTYAHLRGLDESQDGI